MHPRHSYAVLFNSEMDFMVEKLLRDKINDAKVWIAEAELKIDYFRKKKTIKVSFPINKPYWRRAKIAYAEPNKN